MQAQGLYLDRVVEKKARIVLAEDSGIDVG